jgi:hypothetical protein
MPTIYRTGAGAPGTRPDRGLHVGSDSKPNNRGSFEISHARLKRTAVLISLVSSAVWGCSGLVKSHGVALRSADATYEVVMPENAPSIWRGFHAEADETVHKEPPSGHFGIDILGRAGTPVIAAAPGRVESSFFEPMYGNRVVIDHGRDEHGRSIATRYLHLKRRLVGNGDEVRRGQQIGELGATGFLAGGLLHLHFELQREDENGRMNQFDPHLDWVDGIGQVTCFDHAREWPNRPFKTTYPVACRETSY